MMTSPARTVGSNPIARFSFPRRTASPGVAWFLAATGVDANPARAVAAFDSLRTLRLLGAAEVLMTPGSNLGERVFTG